MNLIRGELNSYEFKTVSESNSLNNLNYLNYFNSFNPRQKGDGARATRIKFKSDLNSYEFNSGELNSYEFNSGGN